MLPENRDPAEVLSDAENAIMALEALMAQCEGRQLNGFVKHIGQCITKCQGDFLKMQRQAFVLRDKKRRPKSPTKH